MSALFKSLRGRLILACVSCVFLTAGGLMWFAHTDTIESLRLVERRSLDNVLYLLERDLAMRCSLALQSKAEAVEKIKDDLRLSARKAAARLARAPDSDSDAVLKKLLEAELVGQDLKIYSPSDLSDGESDAENLPPPDLRRPLQGLEDQPAFRHTGGRAVFYLPALKEGKRWLLAASASLASLEAEESRQTAALARDLKDLVADIKIQRTGFALIVDGQGKTVAGNAGRKLPEDLLSALPDTQYLPPGGRRVMVLPSDNGEVLYRAAWFRPLNLHIVLAAPLDELEAPALNLAGRQLALTMLVAGLGTLLGLFLALRIAGPVRKLSMLARTLPEQDIQSLDVEGIIRELPLTRPDEVGDLARSFGHMAGELRRNVRDLVSVTARTQRLEKELELAREIQYGILPGNAVAGPGADLYAAMRTAREVGGDLYDFFFLDDGRLCIVIGDVSDKGIPAAMFMSMTVTLIRVAMQSDRLPPHEAMGRINNTLSRDNPRDMFVTLFIGVLDLKSGELCYSCGGHMPPVLLVPDAPRGLESPMDLVVGGFAGMTYKPLSTRLRPGDGLFLYTDGISEAMNQSGEMFGAERLFDCLSRVSGKNPRLVAEYVMQTVNDHTAGAEQSDDIAIVVLRYSGLG